MKKNIEQPRPEWFASRLREIREEAGLTQLQLAERTGIALRTVTYLEAGDRVPSWATALTLANALGVLIVAFAKEPTSAPTRPKGRPKKP